MKKYIIHKTKINERFDEIAYKYYGNCYKIQAIIEANPHISISETLPCDIELLIPIEDTVEIDNSQLPIWKRSD